MDVNFYFLNTITELTFTLQIAFMFFLRNENGSHHIVKNVFNSMVSKTSHCDALHLKQVEKLYHTNTKNSNVCDCAFGFSL